MAENDQLELIEEVLRLRLWQHIINESMKSGDLKLAVHMAFGYEAIATAVNHVMQDEDMLVLTHRNVAYNLARAGELGPLLDEYKQLPSGLAGAKLGTMNVSNPKRGVVYTSSILGNNMPVGVGLAMSKVMQEKTGVVITLTGDGAMEEGTFYESLHFARSHNVPWLLIVENNKCAMHTKIEERRCPINIGKICEGLEVPFMELTGNWVVDYIEQLSDFRGKILEMKGPGCIEVDLLNLNRHAGSTPGWPSDSMNIDINNGLIVVDNQYDPLHVIKERIESSVFEEIETRLLAEKESV